MSAEFDHVRPFDLQALITDTDAVRRTVKLYDRSSGGDAVAVQVVRTPPGGGSPAGLHTHAFEQVYFVLDGTMGVDVAGSTSELSPGDLVVFPAGVPHRNWVIGEKGTVHLAINAPAPDPDQPIAQSIGQ